MKTNPPKIDYAMVNGGRPPDPRCFESLILNDCGNPVGFWKAAVCESRAELPTFLYKFDDQVFAAIESIDSPLWPMAALIEIDVEKDYRNFGYGSAGLAYFVQQAIVRNCKSALTEIGFETCDISGNEESELRKNLHFYGKNGWTNLFELDDDDLPIDLHDPLHAYRQLCQSTPSSAETPHPPE